MKTNESLARVMCRAENVDPDLQCPGLGKLIPLGETWPAWKVRLKYIDAIIKKLEEIKDRK